MTLFPASRPHSLLRPRTIIAFECRPFRDGQPVIGLRFTYDPELVALLKADLADWREIARTVCRDVPARPGGWLPARRLWWVHPSCWLGTRLVLEEHGYTVEDVESPGLGGA